MLITTYEQSGLIVTFSDGYTLAIDIGAYTPIEKIIGISVDAVLVSHLHGDHFSIEHIKRLKPKKLYVNAECIELLGEENIEAEIIQIKADCYIPIGPAKVLPFEVDHGPNTKIKPRENLGFLIESEAKKIYFAGDMFYESGIDVSSLEVDCALIPVGTFYTFGPEEAARFVQKFKKIEKVIPMHYVKNPETKEQFEILLGDKG